MNEAMKVHLAVSVSDVDVSVAEYTRLLGRAPVVVVPGEYALWRTEVLNFSIRRTTEAPGQVRHVGFEREDAPHFSEYRDVNGLVWETFGKTQQADEIKATWPDTSYDPE